VLRIVEVHVDAAPIDLNGGAWLAHQCHRLVNVKRPHSYPRVRQLNHLAPLRLVDEALHVDPYLVT
jgi:hypothetical protein